MKGHREQRGTTHTILDSAPTTLSFRPSERAFSDCH